MDKPNLAARRIRAMHSLLAADKSAREYKYSGPLVLELLLKKQHRMRLKRKRAARYRFHYVRDACAAPHPPRLSGIQPFSPHSMWHRLNQPHLVIIEIKDGEYLT